jgi:hypothetical protein
MSIYMEREHENWSHVYMCLPYPKKRDVVFHRKDPAMH